MLLCLLCDLMCFVQIIRFNLLCVEVGQPGPLPSPHVSVCGSPVSMHLPTYLFVICEIYLKQLVDSYVYMCIYTCICIHLYIYIYIYGGAYLVHLLISPTKVTCLQHMPIRAWPIRAQGGSQGPGPQGPRGPPRARPTLAQGPSP